MTSFPVGVLRFAGDWSVTENYLYGMYVIATGVPYACGAVSDTGTNPTTQPSVVWFPFPSTGAGVASLQNLTGALSLQSPNGSVTINPSGTTIDLETTGVGGSAISAGGATVACDDPAASGSITLKTTVTGSSGRVIIDTVDGFDGKVDILTIGTTTIDTSAGGSGAGLDIKTHLTSASFESTSTGGSAGSIVFNSTELANPAKVTIGGTVDPTGLYVSNSQLLFNGAAVGGVAGVTSLNTATGAVVMTLQGGMGSISTAGGNIDINPWTPASGTALSATTVAQNLPGSIAWEGTGTSTKAYNAGAMVIYSGATYICLVGQSVGSVPPANGANWQSIGGGGGGSSITAGGATVACDDPAATGNITLTTSAGSNGDVTIDTTSGSGGDVNILTRQSVIIDTTVSGGAGVDIKTGLTTSYFESQNTGGLSGSIIFSSSDPTHPAKVTVGGTVNPTGLYVSNSQLLFNGAAVGAGVDSLQGLTGVVTISSPTANFTNVGQNIQMTINYPTLPPLVDSLNGLTGILTLQSTDGSITINPSGANIDLQVAAPALDVEGLQNKLGIIPALPHTSDTTELAANNDLTPPTAIVPDATAPTSSTTASGALCWLYTKPVSNAGFNWYMYNPRFSAPAAPLPYTKYSSNPAQERIQSVWALVQPAVNTNIYTAGIIALNLYSFDDTNPPTSGFYNTRWAYSNSQGLNSGQSGTNLYAGYTYLIYAYDAPRITNQTGVGQPDTQDWGLRDPYDIYPDVNHIPLQNCVLAFNPDATTNYQTWNTTTIYTNGQTVIYSGFGGTANGIFYTAVGTVPVNTQPVSATGVPSAFWTAISPQPSSYASQPILAMNLNGINGTTAGWTAGPLLRVLSMGYTTGNNPYTQTSGVRYVLN